MSDTGTKRRLVDAAIDAEAFRDLFDEQSYFRWAFAGSLRRGRPEVGDIEHVVWSCGQSGHQRLDALVGHGLFPTDSGVTRAVYPNGSHRWGPLYRGVMFRGIRHELFFAEQDNWGCILAIRTGPGEFSKRLVTALHSTKLRQRDGFLRYADGSIYPCPAEERFFEACGVEWVDPHNRDSLPREAAQHS